jgi:hypothetical protein
MRLLRHSKPLRSRIRRTADWQLDRQPGPRCGASGPGHSKMPGLARAAAGTACHSGTGYLKRMARPRPSDSARVPLGLTVSEADAARIEQVLARPEFAGVTRSEWCRQIIRSALRYYLGDDPAPDPAAVPSPATARASARSVVAEPAPPSQPPVPATASAPMPAAATSSPVDSPGASDPVLAAPAPPAQPECPHPADARDWQTGSCAACGAVLWD